MSFILDFSMTPEKNHQPSEEAELRRCIGDFALGSDDEIIGELLEMSEADVDRRLEEEGLDVQGRIEGIQERMTSAIGRLRLEAARQRRLTSENQPRQSDNWAKRALRESQNYDQLDVVALRAAMGQRLQGQDKAVFFRQAHDLSEEDLRQMLIDQDELEGFDQEEED